MAVTALTPTTTWGTSPTLSKLQRKVQGDALYLFMNTSPEFDFAKTLTSSELNFSGREVTQVAQLEERGGGAFIPDFGYEADPRSIAPRELTYGFSQYNDRISISTFARIQNQKDKAAMLDAQIRYQVNQMANGFGRRFSQTFWGVSSGMVCQTSTDATSASQTLTLINAWGQSESAADNAAYLDRQFCVGDRIAVGRTSGASIIGFGSITAKTAATPSIAVTMTASTNVDANDEIYFAQSVENDTSSLTSADINLWPPGLVDAIETASVHGLSSSSVPEWGAAGNDSSGGRLNGTRLMVAQDALQNRGAKGPWVLAHTQGIKRDIFNQQVAAVRFQDPMNMRLDGAVKVGEGITPFVSKWCPPGRAILMPKGAMSKWFLTELPDPTTGELPDWNDATQVDKVQNRSGFYVGLGVVYSFIHKRNYYYQFKSLTES